jgi:hypothetical protein
MKTRLVLVFKSLQDKREREEFLDELLQAVDVILSDDSVYPQNLSQSQLSPPGPDPQFCPN